MNPRRMLVIPAERQPCDHSFLEEVHTRDGSLFERTFFMRSFTAKRHERSRWNEAHLEVVPMRPKSRLLGSCQVYFFDVRYVGHMWRLARELRPEVVFVRDLTLPFLLALLWRPRFGWKVIYQRSFPHEYGWFDPERLRQYKLPWLHRIARTVEWSLLRRTFRFADAIVPISRRMGEDMVRAGWCDAARIHPFGMGVTRKVLEVDSPPTRTVGDPLRLVYVGTLALRRRMERLVEAVVIAREQHGVDAWLTVLGGTADEVAALREVVRRHDASEHVEVLGRIPREQVYEVMATHHAGAIFIARDPRFVIASTTKLLESLAIGLPCVCTDAVAMHQEMADATGAIVMSDDTAEGFAQAIASLESNWTPLAAAARAHRESVFADHSYEAARERMDRLALALTGVPISDV